DVARRLGAALARYEPFARSDAFDIAAHALRHLPSPGPTSLARPFDSTGDELSGPDLPATPPDERHRGRRLPLEVVMTLATSLTLSHAQTCVVSRLILLRPCTWPAAVV